MAPGTTNCQLCGEDLTSKGLIQRQAHYDEHFASEAEVPRVHGARSAQSDALKAWFTPYSANKGDPETQNIFWYPSQTESPPRNFSPGLIPVLRKALVSSHEKGKTRKAWLCHDRAVHIQGEAFDRTWGCGYRNFLMVCASLMVQTIQPMYFPFLDHPYPPGVRHLQQLIEEAWSAGFDQEGAQQLKRHLTGTGKYIGTGELYVAFTYRGIPSQLVDFELKDGPEPLLNWVLQYFSNGQSASPTILSSRALQNAVTVTDKLPLVLQHDGHSRTIVGCERCPDGSLNLLVFDPSRHIPGDVRAAGLENWNHGSPSTAIRGETMDSARHLVASKVLHEVAHPIRSIKEHHKRKAEDPPANPSAKKQRPHHDRDDDAPAYHSGTTAASQHHSTPETGKVLSAFRLGLNRLKRKNKYQILYFPLTEPLNEEQRWARRDLTCLKIQ
ncbi:DUF1671-domain-containing protein [Daedalea quercina L-15889]|uniref:DUF1671-domain-containing protein n=1 Tax=Daedalea quercina L-15889 TaxID=1314783 RepID=A0A165Q5X9_9APHY|nr:DUF1671-domain-containing protein [Daedalea quercina L-15889]